MSFACSLSDPNIDKVNSFNSNPSPDSKEPYHIRVDLISGLNGMGSD